MKKVIIKCVVNNETRFKDTFNKYSNKKNNFFLSLLKQSLIDLGIEFQEMVVEK